MRISKKMSVTIILLIFVVGVLIGPQIVGNYVYSDQEEEEKPVDIDFDMMETDPTINFLGKSFDEIKQVLGEPDEQGYSALYGPHDYILFHQEAGPVYFCAPINTDGNIVVSIILGPGQEIKGAKVGMPFSEIMDILGKPDFGPEDGMDELYYMGYFIGETDYRVSEVIISFSAASADAPTRDVFIKWEAY